MTKTKKLLSFILVLALLFGVLPFDRLVIADGTNGIVKLLQSGILHAVFSQIRFDIAIIQMGFKHC